jgi:hypothetical protein
MFVAEVRGFGVDEMSYLTKSEKQMEFNMRKAQYYLGIQCSLSKGDGKEMKELMNELIDDALQEGRKQGALEELKRIEEAWHHIGSKGVCNYIERRIKELEKEGV